MGYLKTLKTLPDCVDGLLNSSPVIFPTFKVATIDCLYTMLDSFLALSQDTGENELGMFTLALNF